MEKNDRESHLDHRMSYFRNKLDSVGVLVTPSLQEKLQKLEEAEWAEAQIPDDQIHEVAVKRIGLAMTPAGKAIDEVVNKRKKLPKKVREALFTT